MRLYPKKRRAVGPIIAVLLTMAALVLAVLFAGRTSVRSEEQARTALEQSIRRAMISCYAIEGSFPQSWEYLRDHYGVAVDSRFVVEYEALGGNIMPQVTVLARGGSAL